MPNGTFKFSEKPNMDYRVVVVDEVSMLPKPMWDLLMRHDVYVLATGDPGQLPPVDKDSDNHVLDTPHVFLDEIMRQAQDSEIIRLSMWIREGKPLAQFPCANEQVQIFTQNQVVSGMYEWADQILCATNAKRNSINQFVRQQKGYGIEPEIGDKVISLHNHWEHLSASCTWALTNGTIGTLQAYNNELVKVPRYISEEPVDIMMATLSLEDGDLFNYVGIDYKGLKTGEPALTPRQAYQWRKSKTIYYEVPYDFAYAYAITCHKAQGSEWDKVLVMEEGFPFDKEEHKRWLYTAATRAKEKLVIVRN